MFSVLLVVNLGSCSTFVGVSMQVKADVC